MNLLAVMNQKGGVGKTTIALHVAADLARRGQDTLLVDMDPQGDATRGVGLSEFYDNPETPATLGNALVGEWTGNYNELVHIGSDNLRVIPATMGQFLTEARLVAIRGREGRLGAILSNLTADWCIIDCPPSLGSLTDNALVAAQSVLVVAQAHPTSLSAVLLLMEQVWSINHDLNIPIEIKGLVLNQYENSTTAQRIRSEFENLPFPLLGVVRKRVAVQEAWDGQQTLVTSNPSHHVSLAIRGIVDQLLGEDTTQNAD